MNDLTLIGPELLPCTLTTAEIDATMGYAGRREGAGDPSGLRLGLARLRGLVRSEGRHSPASARGHRRRLSIRAR